jgi:hypothetical protein
VPNHSKAKPSRLTCKSLDSFIGAVLNGPAVDIQFENHGSIVLIHGLSEAGQVWLDENVGDSETQRFGGAIVAEPRYCLAIFMGAKDAGLMVRS